MKEQMKEFDEIFKLESLRGERIHLQFNWFLYSSVCFLSLLVYYLGDNIVGIYGMGLSVVNLLYNAFAFFVNSRKKSVAWLSYSTIFVNVLTLTIYNFIDACYNSNFLPATTAALLLYPIVIFLASLRMDKYLIIWASALSIVAMNGLYIYFYPTFDKSFDLQPMSIDILAQIYRTIYLIIIAVFIYSVPNTMRRILKTQEQIVRESYENKKNAQRDSLTGVYNRMYFEQHLAKCIQAAKDLNHKVALLFIDLDRFKELNDNYGHDLGDYALKAIANDIIARVGEEHLLARIGGDEFILIMSNVTDIDEVKTVSSKVLSEITRLRRFKENEVAIGASIGVSLYPDDTQDMDELVKYADIAMYSAKRTKQKGIKFYTSITSEL